MDPIPWSIAFGIGYSYSSRASQVSTPFYVVLHYPETLYFNPNNDCLLTLTAEEKIYE